MSRLLSKIIRYWALVGGALLIIVVVLTAINAAGFTANFIARLWGGNVSGLPGYEDAVTMLIGVAALAMFPYCQMQKGHAAVDVFMQYAPQGVRTFVEYLSNILVIIVALGLGYYLIDGTLQNKGDKVETAVLAWPVWVFMLTAIPSCALWAVAALLPISPEKENSDGA